MIALSGRMDGIASDFIYDCFRNVVASDTKKVVLDCGELDHMSSAGLSALVRLHLRLKKEGGQIKVADAKSNIIDILRIVHFEKLFGICDSVDDAVREMGEVT